ncbi:phage baseplate assembly protein V [Frateuria aurantia]|uniref:Phage baseplate assembly protein V n=1 Tax=Frateuria aurantia (strain ATCC 33424 / DSM 6220 / KCTC 2777 / LMG 1558 / NBRC 3245 / NCIMB 13370) TaxID=767434 RepID=H8L2J8_FRAAD|nr:phage baseplate assembly protein V [Frateuria aurantia]AFC85465.1 phage baseplate assembly protein V [Frateuria aurantia DSM 6220]
MSYPLAEHDRMIAAMLLPCVVEAVDPVQQRIKVSNGDWISPWVRWHSGAAGAVQIWRVPSVGEPGVLLSPSGTVAAGTFVPGLLSAQWPNSESSADVTSIQWPDGTRIAYDAASGALTAALPKGQLSASVGQVSAVLSEQSAVLTAPNIKLAGTVEIEGDLTVSGTAQAASLSSQGGIDAKGNIQAAGTVHGSNL